MIWSWIFELGFRVGFSSKDVESVFFEMLTSNPAATNRLLLNSGVEEHLDTIHAHRQTM